MKESRRIRVLIIDDDVLACEALRLSLTEDQFDVVGVEHEISSFTRLVERMKPDVVLMDFDMSELKRRGALERMKSLLADVPVMIMTADNNPGEAASALAAGASALFSKERLDLRLLPDMIRVIARGKDAVVDGEVLRSAMAVAGEGEGRKRTNVGNGNVSPPDELSLLELEILRLALQVYREREIAERLSINTEEVEAALQNICEKLQVEDRSRLEAVAVRLGLTDES